MAEIKGADLLAKSLKEQGVQFMFGVVGFPVGPTRRGGAKGRPALYRHAQRADGVLCRRRRRLSDRPPGLVHRRDRSGRHPRPRRPGQRAAELLADAADRRRIGDLPQRHGRLPGGAPGAGRDAALQMGARASSTCNRIPFYVEMAVRQSIYGRPGAAYLDIADDIITGSCDADKAHRGREMPRSAAHRRRCRSTSSRR